MGMHVVTGLQSINLHHMSISNMRVLSWTINIMVSVCKVNSQLNFYLGSFHDGTCRTEREWRRGQPHGKATEHGFE